MFVVCFPPQIHKQVMIYDSAYELVHDTKPEVETKVLPTKTNTQTTVKAVNNVISNANQNSTVSVVPKKMSNTVVQTTTSSKSVKTAPVKSTVTTHTKTQPKQVSTNTTKAQKQTTQVKKTQTTVPKKTAATETKPALTQQSVQTTAVQKQKAEELELIKWNKWRSDIQNQIMRDVKLPIVPQGTVFKFQFDVDKYGKIMNIQTWSTNPSFTPFAIQYIAPVIRSYQGRSILNFPQGSNRISTTVEGGWKISAQTKYSKPADFKDVEKVRN